MPSKFVLYFFTLKYLKPSQIYWRLWFGFSHIHIGNTKRCDLRLVCGHWKATARRLQTLLENDTFSFLNVLGRLSEIGWDGPNREKLWRYNQHYFDDLNSFSFATRSEWHYALIERWINENHIGQGTGWEPYPTSLRIVNWFKWLLAGQSLSEKCLQSLAIQTRFLYRRVEWHILGNHLFANAKALVFAGLCFQGSEAQKWMDTGLAIITRELTEQVLPDGGNFERSPMYHTIFLEDILDLINLAGAYPSLIRHNQLDQLRTTATKMLIWLLEMCHPDGDISFFNDAAFGIAPSPAEIKAYAGRLGISPDRAAKSTGNQVVRRFADSGYIRLSSTNAEVFLDVAPIGPDYLPGHAHADTLSFELSLFGERVLVNGGTSQYGNGPLRLEERGTAAHNTVEINGKNSSEVWSGFRVARRAYPYGIEIEHGDESIFVTCAHNGYMRLKGRPVHKRSWQLWQGKLVVQDRVDGNFDAAIAHFHFHPELQVVAIDRCRYALRLPHSSQVIHFSVLKGVVTIKNSFFAPEFGIRQASQSLAVHFEAHNEIAIEISWSINE